MSAAFFIVGPRPGRRAVKGLFIAALNFATFAAIDWLFPGPTIGVPITWAFSVGVFCGYFFWADE
jgi:hypothetical protein